MHNPYKKKLITEMIVNVVLSLLLLINTLPVSYGAVLAADEMNNEEQVTESVDGTGTTPAPSTTDSSSGQNGVEQQQEGEGESTPENGTPDNSIEGLRGVNQLSSNLLGNVEDNQEVEQSVPDVTKYKIFTSYGEGGTINVSPAVATEGETVYFEIVPNTGYEYVGKSITGSTYEDVPITEITDNKFSFVMPNADVTIGATFKDASLRNIGVLALADRGTVTLSTIEAHKGDNITFTITPNDGYKTNKVSVYSEDFEPINYSENDGTYSFEMIDKGVTVDVTFTPLNNPHVFDFAENGNELTATCSDEDCDLHNTPAVLELNAANADYNPNGYSNSNISINYDEFFKETDIDSSAVSISYKVIKTGDPNVIYNDSLPTNAGDYTYIVDIVIDGQKYSISDNFSIAKATLETQAPVFSAKTSNSIQINNVKGQEYVLKIYNENLTDEDWNSSITSDEDVIVFDNLISAMAYNVYTRVKETENTYKGEVKSLGVVTTVSSIGPKTGSDFSQLIGNTLYLETERETVYRKWYAVDESGTKTLISNEKDLLLTEDYLGKTIYVEVPAYSDIVGDFSYKDFGPVSYGTVHFETYGGTQIDDVTGLKYGDKVTRPAADPTKEGATFGGWYKDDDFTELYNFESEITETETTIYALWNVDSKTVWYHYVDGLEEKMKTETYSKADTDAELLELTDTESHKFLGWKTSEETDEIAFPVNSAYNYNKLQDQMNLYAAWQEKDKANYTVNIYTENLNGKSYKLNAQYIENDYIGKEIVLDYNYGVDYDGYSINYSYSTRSGKVKADGSLELSFYLDMNHYEVAFNGNEATGGSMENQDFASQEVKKLSPNGYTKDGYTFVGWNEKANGSGKSYSDEETVGFLGSKEGEVVTLYAQWKVDDNTEYTVKHWVQKMGNHKTEDFDYDEDFKEYKTETKQGTTGSVIEADSFKKNLVNFNYLGSDATAETVISGDGTTVVNLYYTRKHYTVTFDANGGTGTAIDPITVWSGESATLPEIGFERTGYTLYNWWNTQADGNGDEYAPGESIDGLKGDLVLYADWISNDYYIEFDANGGEGYMVYQWFEYDEAENLRKNVFKRTGYEFDYWTIEGDTTGRQFADEAEILNLTDKDEEEFTFIANWKPITYTITYDLDGGTQLHDNPTEYTVETDTFYLGVPGKKGYTFEGWTGSNGEVPQDVVYIAKGSTGNRTYKANYSSNTYILTFDANGGKVDPLVTHITYGMTYGEGMPDGKLPTPTRDGYTFVGWMLGEKEIRSEDTVNILDDIQVVAKWTLDEYVIKYNGLEGTNFEETNPNPDSYSVTSKSILLQEPKKVGYTFTGWTGSNGTEPQKSVIIDRGSTGNKEYTANFEANKYVVTFDANGGQINPDKAQLEVIYDSNYGEFPWPTRAGYTFNGWYTAAEGGSRVQEGDKVQITDNSTFYAQWTINTYNISYELNGGTLETENPATYTVEDKITFNNPTKTGYTFTGWKDGNDNVVTGIKKGTTEDQSFTATFKANEYVVTFNANGGKCDTTAKNVTYDSNYGELPTPTRNGYTFAGWFTAAEDGERIQATDKVQITEAITLYAHWDVVTYNITYSGLDGATVDENPATYTIETETFTLNNPTKVGYKFVGWDDGSGNRQSNVTISKGTYGNKSYTAVFEANTVIVILDANGGNVDKSYVTVKYDDTYANLPTRDNTTRIGYSFVGWFTEAEGGSRIRRRDRVNVTDEAIKLYAHWEVIPYDIVYHGLKGSNIERPNPNPEEYNIETETFTLQNPTKIGYTFIGWTGSNGDVPELTVTIEQGSTEDKEYWANFEINEYVVLYLVGEGGTMEGDPTFTYTIEDYSRGRNIDLNMNVTKLGYTFTGWKVVDENGVVLIDNARRLSAGNRILANLVLVANFTANHYFVEYDANGGQINPDKAQLEVIYDSNYGEFPWPTRAGYTFNGWYTAAEGGSRVQEGDKVQITDNSTFYAQWTINTYNISYELNGGTLETENPATYTVEDKITFNNPTKTGYTFTGWKDGNDNVVTGIKKGTTEDQSFTATFKANEYNVVFNANGGEGTMEPQDFVYDESKSLNENVFTRDGYDFMGWSTNKDGSGSTYADKAEVKNLVTEANGTKTLYANWKEFEYDDITSATTNNWTIGSNGSIDFTFKRSSSDDEKVTVDGQEVSKTYAAFLAALKAGRKVRVDGTSLSEDDFTAKSGSLILTLKDSYLNRLNPGTHTLSVDFLDNGYRTTVSTQFIVRPKPVTPRHNVPMTGVGADSLSVYRTMSLVTALGVLIIIKEKDRFKKDRYKDFN